ECDQLHPVFLEIGDTFEVIGVMSPHFKYTGLVAFPFDGLGQVRTAYIDPFGDRRSVQSFSGLKEMLDLPKYPRVTDRSTTDHDPVDFVFLSPGRCFFDR